MTNRSQTTRFLQCSAWLVTACAAFLLLVSIASPAAAEQLGDPRIDSPDLPDAGGYAGSYSYVRVLEGSATLIQGDTGDRDQLQVNQPVLVGDRIWVAPRGRLEIVLSDRNLLRIDSGSEVVFDALAGSPDRQDPLTVLRVPQGNAQLVVVSDFLGDGLPRVDTPNATVYAYDLGTFRITSDSENWTEVVARDGSAEVVTHNDSFLIEAGDEAIVDGDRDPSAQVRQASNVDSLELWGERLDREARYAENPYVDESLRYETANLDRYGSWVTIDGRSAWRPRVAADWRPYWNGRWSNSPLGYTWVSYEPWGWVPYHYGTWDYVPGYGWSWFPGVHFAPAWVYWYWTDAYVGWVPVGYYTRFYRPFFGGNVGFRFGVYGWIGGSWNDYHDWNFCDLRYFGGGYQNHHVYRGNRFPERAGHAVPRRGILTTDTRGLSHVATQRGDHVVEQLARRTRPGASGSLPDATAFVARKPAFSRDLQQRIVIDRKGQGRDRVPVVLADDNNPAAVRRGDGRTPSGPSATWTDGGDRARATRSIRGDLPTGDRGATDRSATDQGARIGRTLPPRGVSESPERARTERANEIRSVRPETPRTSPVERTRSDAGATWRDRSPILPERRTGQDGVAPRRDPRVDRSQTERGSGSADRTPIPRRVIDGVRGTTRDSGGSSRTIERRPVERDRSVRSRTETERSSSSARSRSSSPPPRRSSEVSSRSSSSSQRSSVSHRSSSSSSSRSGSAARSRGSSGSSRSSGSSSHSKSRGRPPA